MINSIVLPVLKPTIMKQQNMISTFRNALSGCVFFFRNERNGKIQLAVAIVTIAFAIWMGISATEWLVLLLCIAAVFALEMINSAIERICDMIQPDLHPTIKIIKDVAAGAVFLSSIISFVVGMIIFLPKIKLMFIK